MEIKIEDSWKEKLLEDIDKEYFKKLVGFVKDEYTKGSVLPKKDQIFRAFELCPFDKVKVVILGQDPYPTLGHAHGLCFSCDVTVRPLPKSLKNIFKEYESDLGLPMPKNGDLSNWAKEGVLLLNTVLTVREGEANSHANYGWEDFTDTVIQQLNKEKKISFTFFGVLKLKRKGKVLMKKEI